MKIELIPVIELGYNNQGIETPEKYPYWENPDIWYEYRRASLKKAGFKGEIEPYLKGSPFYEPKEISDINLIKVVLDFTESFREDNMKERELTNPFYGGCVLKINQEDKYFPQCCGDLGDIKYWEKLSNKQNSYYEGHPAPNYDFKKETLILDFSIGEYDEHFEPTPPEVKLSINVNDLKLAVENAKNELRKLAERIRKINHDMNLGIDRIDDLLIWKNPNHD